MDWIVAGVIGVGAIWIASRILEDGGGASADRCERCGADLQVSEQGIELLRLGLTGTLPASCTACGTPGALEVTAIGADPWER